MDPYSFPMEFVASLRVSLLPLLNELITFDIQGIHNYSAFDGHKLSYLFFLSNVLKKNVYPKIDLYQLAAASEQASS